MKKLYRSRTNKTFTGLLGGLGKYLDMDPVVVRLIFVLFLIVSQIWPAVIVYIIGYLVVPVQSDVEVTENKEEEPKIHDV